MAKDTILTNVEYSISDLYYNASFIDNEDFTDIALEGEAISIYDYNILVSDSCQITVSMKHIPTGKYIEKSIIARSDNVYMSIVTNPGYLNGSWDSYTGHTLLYIENDTFTDTIMIGYMEILPGNAITIGRYPTRTSSGLTVGAGDDDVEHEGIWYNIEARDYHSGDYQDTRSLKTILDSDDILALNTYIRNNDNVYNIFTTNCVHFAIGAWNMVSSVLISDEFTVPNSLYNWVDNRTDSIDNLPLISAYNYVGYYDGNQLKEYQWYN